MCPGCEAALPRLDRPYCSICAAPGPAQLCDWCATTPPAIDGIRAPYLMGGVVEEMIYGLKYRNMRASAPELGRLLTAYMESDPIAADVLMPVALHKRRQRERGYNQSELLAREVGKLTGVPMETRTLLRTRNTPLQVSLRSDEERRQNMEGAFRCVSEMVGKRVLLVDDVVTTGSTMSACARVLKEAGARSVWGLTLARQG